MKLEVRKELRLHLNEEEAAIICEMAKSPNPEVNLPNEALDFLENLWYSLEQELEVKNR